MEQGGGRGRDQRTFQSRAAAHRIGLPLTMPLLAKRLRIDSAVVSAPMVTTLVDATGLIIYFLIAHAVLNL